jgi:hypothetical protein
MKRLRVLQEMAGLRKTRAERVVERQIRQFRRQRAEHEQALLLADKVRDREKGAEGMRPMPYANIGFQPARKP